MTRYPYTTTQNYLVFREIYIYIYLQSLVSKRNGCLHISEVPFNQSLLHPSPFPLFTGNHYQEFSLYPSNPLKSFVKNIHTYMYPLPIYSSEFCEEHFQFKFTKMSWYQMCHSATSLPPSTFMRSFSVIQISPVTFYTYTVSHHKYFPFYSSWAFKLFPIYGYYKSCHSKQPGTYFLSIKTQKRIAGLSSNLLRKVYLLPRS